MTRFALLVWAYSITNSATTLALLGFFSFILYILFSPIGGIAADRFDRRMVMIVADAGAGAMTITLAILHFSGGLEVWHLFLVTALTGVFESFQRPAYSAASSVLVPKAQFSRLNALRTIAYDGSRIIAPFMGGLLLAKVGLGAVFMADIATFLIAMFTLAIVRIPRPKQRPENVSLSFRDDLRFGLRYIAHRPGLLGLMILFMFIHLVAALTYMGVMNAMILARTGGDELALATVQGMLGGAAVIGGIALGIWGGPKKQIHMLVWTMIISFLFGDFLMGTGRSLPAWAIGATMTSFFIPFLVSADRTIWQRKVALDAQGRVFAMRATVVEAAIPIGYLIAGPLADKLFEPAMQPGLLNLPATEWVLNAWRYPLLDGALVERFGWLVGTGPGAGMGLMFVCTSVMGTIVTLAFYASRSVRRVEDTLPDFDDDGLAVPVVS
jgi:MFS transporter, DHA3 family, macrolide efflux protein